MFSVSSLSMQVNAIFTLKLISQSLNIFRKLFFIKQSYSLCKLFGVILAYLCVNCNFSLNIFVSSELVLTYQKKVK